MESGRAIARPLFCMRRGSEAEFRHLRCLPGVRIERRERRGRFSQCATRSVRWEEGGDCAGTGFGTIRVRETVRVRNGLDVSMDTGAESTHSICGGLPSGMIRGVDLPIGAGGAIKDDAISQPPRFRSIHRDEYLQGTSESGEPEPYPVWICAILLVAYCAVFWVGAVTVGGWLWDGVISLLH